MLYEVITGCAVRILHATTSQNDIQFVAEGLQRVEITNWLSHEPPYLVEVRYPGEGEMPEIKTEIKARNNFV